MIYNYERFWEERGQFPAEEFDTTKKELVKNILQDIDYLTVLEFGCGNGELSQLIKSRECHITGVDISEDRLQMNNDVDAKICTNVINDYFYPVADLVICSHFLLHIKPQHIKDVMKTMSKYTTKWLIFIEPHPNLNLGKWEDYNFNHDYDVLCKELNLNAMKVYIDKYVGCWIIKK